MENKIDNQKEFKAILDQMNDIYIKKNNDYGDSFTKTCKQFGLTAPLIRMTDKLNRFEQLTHNLTGQQCQDESIEDTLIDLANYAILTVLYYRQYKLE